MMQIEQGLQPPPLKLISEKRHEREGCDFQSHRFKRPHRRAEPSSNESKYSLQRNDANLPFYVSASN